MSKPELPESHFAWTALERAYTNRKEGEVLPVWFLTLENGEHHIIGTPILGDSPVESDRAKDIIADTVATWVLENKATEVMFVSDTWMRSLPPDAPESETRKRVSQQLDSVEAIVVQVWNRDKTGFTLARSYRENEIGTLTILEEMYNPGEGDTTTFRPVVEALAALAEWS